MSIEDKIAALAAKAAELNDQTDVKEGGDFEYTPPKEGKTIARFIEYIELGKHGQKPFQGTPKPDADEVRLTFELLNEKRGDIKTIEVEGGGTKKIADRISVRMPIKLNDRAKFVKLFRKMAYGRDAIKHMAQMLGEPFIITIIHNTAKDDPKKIYANIADKDGNWTIEPPRYTDPMSGESKDISGSVPAALSPLKIFLWNAPDKEQWGSLFIEGTRTVKRDGRDVEVSKNWLQEVLLSAKNYKGSPLDTLLSGLGDLSIAPEKTGAAGALTALSTDTSSMGNIDSDDLAALGLGTSLDDEIPF